MKNLIFSLLFIFYASAILGQINYSVGIGPQYNFGSIEPTNQFENSNNFSYFGKGELYYSKNKMTYNIAALWNRINWFQRGLGIISSGNDLFQFRTDYINLNPSIGFKPIKFIGINVGGYFALNIVDATFERNSETWVNANGVNVTSKNDYGLSFGINGYFLQNISLELKYNLGFKNLRDGSDISFTDNDGNLLDDFSLKNRTIQLGFNYHFNDFD